MPVTNLLLLSVVTYVIAAVDWAIYGRKSLAVLGRQPSLIFWACLEVLLGAVVGYIFYDSFSSRDPVTMISVVGSTVAGCATGCALSGAVKWGKDESSVH